MSRKWIVSVLVGVLSLSMGTLFVQAQNYYRLYEEGFRAYLGRDFKSALERFQEGLSLREEDAPRLNMVARIEALVREPLPADWDGSVALDFK